MILVHRSTLIEQWITSLCEYIPEIRKKDIGVLGGGRKKLKGTIDIAMLQSIANIDELEEKTTEYDFLIIDECHRVPTVTFEPVLKTINARYVLGLTATPQRKDRFESIIFMQCGPIAYTVEDVNLQSQERKVFFRSTSLPDIGNVSSIQKLWEYITKSKERNVHILSDIAHLLSEGRLTQYVGRLHRQTSSDKKEIVVYDYVDTCSGMTISMFKKRLSAYKKLGYIPVYNPGDKIAKWL